MSNEEILKQAIEKAVKSGWIVPHIKGQLTKQDAAIIAFFGYKDNPNDVLFSHSFAKAFWGDEPHDIPGSLRGKEWQYNLQQMVLEENPVSYLEKFL